jgi:hypothetical protein
MIRSYFDSADSNELAAVFAIFQGLAVFSAISMYPLGFTALTLTAAAGKDLRFIKAARYAAEILFGPVRLGRFGR